MFARLAYALCKTVFVLKIKTAFVTGCIFFVFDARFFVVCWQDFFLVVTSDFKAEF